MSDTIILAKINPRHTGEKLKNAIDAEIEYIMENIKNDLAFNLDTDEDKDPVLKKDLADIEEILRKVIARRI